MSIPEKILAIDIGNTRTKLLLDDKLLAFSYSDTEWLQKFIDFLSKKKISKVYYCSVNNLIADKIFDILQNQLFLEYYNIIDLIRDYRIIEFDHISGIGDDRVVSLASALFFESPPLITVDCGTAITINVLDENKKCLGGAIFAGLNTQMDALAIQTQKLRKINFKEQIQLPAQNTEDALNSGIVIAVVGGVKEIISRIMWSYFTTRKLTIIFTGGNAPLIYKYFNYPLKSLLIDDLNNLGIQKIANLYGK